MSIQIERSEVTNDFTFDDVAVVMATYNESAAIETVLRDIERVTDGRAEVVCVDSSSDGTPDVAKAHGATVVKQEPQGYGVAVREAILTPNRPVIMTTDCDDTYPMDRIPDFLDAINQGFDVVSGDRLSLGPETMPRMNRFGNHLFAWLTTLLTGTRVHDTTTGMRAYRREVVRAIEWTENTGLSAELLIRPLMRGYAVKEVSIAYSERAGETTLDPITGGIAIAKSIVKVGIGERFQPLQTSDSNS